MEDKLVPKRPIVWAYIGHDDKSRGDTKGAIGLAETIARLTGGQYVYVDKEVLKNQFNGIKDTRELLGLENRNAARLYAEQHGSPDILLGTYSDNIINSLPKQPTLESSRVIESISEKYNKYVYRGGGILQKQKVVPHNLNEKLLAQEGDKFRDVYPDIQGELVGVLMGGLVGRFKRDKRSELHEDLSERLLERASFLKNPTLFLCPSRRTGDGYDYLKSNLEKKVMERQYEHIKIKGMTFEETQEGFNPYYALIGLSDHLVVCGDSYSIISEALFSDKTVHTYKTSQIDAPVGRIVNIEKIERGDKSLRHSLKSLWDMLSPDKTCFETKTVKRINPTEYIAKELIKKYEDCLRESSENHISI